MPLGSRWAVQESCLLAGEIDVAVTAAERENRRGLWGYIYSSTSVNVPRLEVDIRFLHLRIVDAECVNKQTTPPRRMGVGR